MIWVNEWVECFSYPGHDISYGLEIDFETKSVTLVTSVVQ